MCRSLRARCTRFNHITVQDLVKTLDLQSSAKLFGPNESATLSCYFSWEVLDSHVVELQTKC